MSNNQFFTHFLMTKIEFGMKFKIIQLLNKIYGKNINLLQEKLYFKVTQVVYIELMVLLTMLDLE